MANYTWKLATVDGKFTDPTNWDQGMVPGPGDTAVIDTSSVPASSGAKVATYLDQTTLDGVSALYRYTWDSQGQATLPSAYISNATLGAGTTLTVTATDSNTSDNGLTLSSGAEIPLFGTNTRVVVKSTRLPWRSSPTALKRNGLPPTSIEKHSSPAMRTGGSMSGVTSVVRRMRRSGMWRP